jgi:hypothetical protein
MNVVLKTLGAEGLQRFHTLEPDAVSAVTERFYSTLGARPPVIGMLKPILIGSPDCASTLIEVSDATATNREPTVSLMALFI